VAAIEVKVPDIGDFKDVPVIEVLVKAGDAVKKDDSLVVLESDKATMEVPAPSAGTVKEIRVKLGDKVSEGTPIVTLEQGDAAAAPAAKPAAPAKAEAAPPSKPAPAPAPAAPAPHPPRLLLPRSRTLALADASLAPMDSATALAHASPAYGVSRASSASTWHWSRDRVPRAASQGRHPGIREGRASRAALRLQRPHLPAADSRWTAGVAQGRLRQVRPSKRSPSPDPEDLGPGRSRRNWG
jgi:pyruvate/2-oxoglutarate dehydrogenase complex dihydrolipoamide acyltransferase (E2) component